MEERKKVTTNISVSEIQAMEANQYLYNKGYGQTAPLTATRILLDTKQIKHEATAARHYLKVTGQNVAPDRVREALNLSTSSATLGRKFRDSSTGDNPELLRSYYVNDKGRRIAQYRWNPDHKEVI